MAIRSNGKRCVGLRYVEPHLLVRFLDNALCRELGLPCEVVSVPLDTLASWHVHSAFVVIVENKVNLMTLPRRSRGIALGGLGNGAGLFRYLPWLHTNRLVYWGDMDVEGFEILSRVRTLFPNARSALMSPATLLECFGLTGPGTGREPSSTMTPPLLSPDEVTAFKLCLTENLRLEQERIPQARVIAELERSSASD